MVDILYPPYKLIKNNYENILYLNYNLKKCSTWNIFNKKFGIVKYFYLIIFRFFSITFFEI
jgi:hypothetical protein